MTVLALPGADITSAAAVTASRIDGVANLIGAVVLLPGIVLGAVMFIAQSI